ncbi:hypothetical protein T06_1003 [Trichinella sp. T6]|nr:hypothetical protein T06_1003 [Trichinella sp. T6]
MAQRNRVGPITQRSVDRNHALLSFFMALLLRCGSGVCVF